MLNISTSKYMEFISPKNNKALNIALQNATPQEIKSFLYSTDLKSLLENIFKNNLKTSDVTLLSILKNNTTLNNLGTVQNNIKNLLEITKFPLLSKFLINIDTLNSDNMKEVFTNSGIFLESKLKNTQNIKEVCSKDLKAILLQMNSEISISHLDNKNEILKQIDKILLQIDYYQLLSHISHSSYIYLPFLWDLAEDGKIEIIEDKNSKFHCNIDISLKKFGALHIKVMLYEKNKIDILLYAEDNNFKTILRKNIYLLKQELQYIEIFPQNIKVFNYIKKDIENYIVKNSFDIGLRVDV